MGICELETIVDIFSLSFWITLMGNVREHLHAIFERI